MHSNSRKTNIVSAHGLWHLAGHVGVGIVVLPKFVSCAEEQQRYLVVIDYSELYRSIHSHKLLWRARFFALMETNWSAREGDAPALHAGSMQKEHNSGDDHKDTAIVLDRCELGFKDQVHPSRRTPITRARTEPPPLPEQNTIPLATGIPIADSELEQEDQEERVQQLVEKRVQDQLRQIAEEREGQKICRSKRNECLLRLCVCSAVSIVLVLVIATILFVVLRQSRLASAVTIDTGPSTLLPPSPPPSLSTPTVFSPSTPSSTISPTASPSVRCPFDVFCSETRSPQDRVPLVCGICNAWANISSADPDCEAKCDPPSCPRFIASTNMTEDTCQTECAICNSPCRDECDPLSCPDFANEDPCNDVCRECLGTNGIIQTFLAPDGPGSFATVVNISSGFVTSVSQATSVNNTTTTMQDVVGSSTQAQFNRIGN